MGRQEFLIDSNVIIEYIGETLPVNVLTLLDNIIDNKFYISVINKIELLGFEGITDYEILKFQELINASNLIDLNEIIVNKTIEIRRKNKVKLPDAIIAASALIHNLTIISRNTKDFQRIDELEIINPYEIKNQ